MSTFRLAWELIRYRPLLFSVSFVNWTLIHAIPVIFGVLIGRIFDLLANSAPASEIWPLVILFAVLAIGRNAFLWIGDVAWIGYWNDQTIQLQRNLLGWILQAPGSRVIPLAPGEAVSTFRDDVEDLLEYVENYVDLGGVVIFGIGAVWVMAGIDPTLTILVLIPLLLTIILTQRLSPEIRRRRHAMREATDDVTGFIGEAFGAVQSLKLARREESIINEFSRLNEIRRHAAMRDTYLTELLRSINVNMATIGSALVLIVAAFRIGTADFTLGDLTVFLVFLPRLTNYMAFVGDIIAQHRRTGVAFDRIRQLAVDASDERLVDRTRVPLQGDIPGVPDLRVEESDRLERLQVTGLTYGYPSSGEGIEDIDLDLMRGSFTVVTGKIGAGKTTLVRALLGLVPAAGEIRWNDHLVTDAASFFVPPRSAYTPQVPRLFSESLAENIALGQAVTRERLREAVDLAVLDPDLERMENGLDTLIGARGVKLSGGQVQRSAAARMFATEADLMVFDDLSSALDVHTEAELWKRVFEQRDVTCLVVSHRRAALERADHILLVERGRIVGRGTLAELLETSPLMRELWAEEESVLG